MMYLCICDSSALSVAARNADCGGAIDASYPCSTLRKHYCMAHSVAAIGASYYTLFSWEWIDIIQ